MAVFIAPFPKTKIQAAELGMFGSCRHRCSEPIFLDAEVLCRTCASVSVLVVVCPPLWVKQGQTSNSSSDHMGKNVATLPDLVLVLLI
jgi:hypothetical protein